MPGKNLLNENVNPLLTHYQLNSGHKKLESIHKQSKTNVQHFRRY